MTVSVLPSRSWTLFTNVDRTESPITKLPVITAVVIITAKDTSL